MLTVLHCRTAPLTLVVLGLTLSACSSSQPAPESGPQIVRDRLAAAGDAPYSAELRAITQSGTRRLQLMEGRVNLNAPFTGRTTETTEQYTEDVVITRQKVYRRATKTQGPWQQFPVSAAKGGIPTDWLPQYMRLMLAHSATVHQDSEPLHVSARLTPKDIESVYRAAGRNLGPAATIDADAWIDNEGRVVRVRPKIHFASDPDIEGTITFTDFKDPMPVNAPASCGPSRPKPMPRAGSTGAWSASIPRPAALISTRLAHPATRRPRDGARARRATAPMRPWDAREVGSQARSTLRARAGSARSGLSSRPAGGGMHHR